MTRTTTTTTKAVFRRRCWCWFWLLLWLQGFGFGVVPTEAFASWLKCFVDLDPSEVIMNQHVVPAHEAEHRGVVLEVRFPGSPDWIAAPPGGVLQWPAMAEDDEDVLLEIGVRLGVPPSLASEGDVQFVAEATPERSSDIAAEAVEFRGQGVMCDGGRAFSRSHAAPVVLGIDLGHHPGQGPVALVAGYAAGMHAVTLTQRVLLVPPGGGGEKDEL